MAEPKGPVLGDSELWAALTQVPRPYRIVDFPRTNPLTGKPVGQIAIRVLTQEEQMICASAADREAKRILKEAPVRGTENRGYDDIYNNAAACEILCRACRRIEDLDKPAYPHPGAVRKEFSTDEVAVLMRLYFQVQSEIGPLVSAMTDDECEAWISRLEKAGDLFPLALLSQAAQDRLLKYMASQLSRLRTDKSSVGSQPAASGDADKSTDLQNSLQDTISDEFAT